MLLIGSRAGGSAVAGSDYDFIWVLTDEGMAARTARGERQQVKEGEFDVNYIGVRRIRQRVEDLDWATRALLSAQIVSDRTGELAAVLAQMRASAGERARSEVASVYDAYLNCYTRSLKAWRRQNELGGRIHAVESIVALARTLYGVAGRWPVYHDELERIAGTGDPSVQQQLETRVENFMTTRGTLHEWDDALDELRAWRF